MNKRMNQLEPIWEHFVGGLTPYEFMAAEANYVLISWAVDQYVQSMADEFPDIVNYSDALKEYMTLYLT